MPWEQAADVWREAVRRHLDGQGVALDSARALHTVKTNSDKVPARGDQVLRTLRELAGVELDGGRVLDVGCGFGSVAAYLALRSGATVTGTDISDAYLNAARACAEGAGLADRLSFAKADMRDLSVLPEGAFDVALAYGVLIFLPTGGDLDRALAEIARVLAPGGVLVVHQANRWRARDPFTGVRGIQLLPAPLWRAAARRRGKTVNASLRLVSNAELARRARRAGLETLGIVGLGGKRRESRPGNLLGTSFALAARRPN